MKTEEITYENMVHRLPEAVPALKAAYDKQIEYWEGEEPPVHPAYSMIVNDTLDELLGSNGVQSEDTVRQIFDFLEVLANHPDEKIQNVVYVSICEHIASNEFVLQKAQKYMGKTTREFCHEIVKARSDLPPHGK